MNDSVEFDLTLSTPSGLIPFYPLLQRGFQVRTRLGCSIQAVLTEDLGLQPDYIENRIQTVFLDGHPVDDVTQTAVTEGAVLALSAAMPGLVGATMRRSGVLAGFRDTITYRASDACASDDEGVVTIKLFNLLVRELGPRFLERGIWVESGVLVDLLTSQRDTLERDCRRVRRDGKAVGMKAWVETVSTMEKGPVRLTVHAPHG